MRPLVPLILVLGIAGGARATEPLAPGQFAQGFALDTPAGGAVYRLDLAEPVYRALSRGDLADLAVFNGAGEAVPLAIEPAQVETVPAAVEHALPYYPVSAEAAVDPRSALEVKVDTGGAVVSVRAPAVAAENTQAWIVDAGDGSGALRGLRLQWDAPAEQFVHAVSVYASTDLVGWSYVAQATLADLDHGGHRLHRDTIEVSSGTARFLRIDWPAGNVPPPLRAVFGREAGAAAPLARGYSVLRGSAASAPDTGWVFDTGGPLPVDRLRVQLPGDNNLAELRVWSRADATQRWIDRGQVLAYRLYADGAVLESAEAELPLTRDRHWRLESTTGDVHALGQAPEILLGWRPDRLLFLARGSAPFTLAAGSATGVVEPQAVSSLLGSVGKAQREELLYDAWLGEQHALGGEQALRIPEPPVPWQRYLMWALLVGGVIVLIRMALTLLRGSPR